MSKITSTRLEVSGKQSIRQRYGRKQLTALFAATVLLTGTSLPAIAQLKPTDASIPTTALEKPETIEFVELTDAEVQQIVEDVVAEQTKDWNAAEKAAMDTVMSIDMDYEQLAKLAELPEAQLMIELEKSQQLSGLKAFVGSDHDRLTMVKNAFVLSTAARFGTYLFRSAASGVIEEVLRMSFSNLMNIFNAMRSGNRSRINRALYNAFPRNRTFVRLAGTAASRFCTSATFGLRRRACNTFTAAAQRTALSLRRRNRRASTTRYRPSTTYRPSTRRRALETVAAETRYTPVEAK